MDVYGKIEVKDLLLRFRGQLVFSGSTSHPDDSIRGVGQRFRCRNTFVEDIRTGTSSRTHALMSVGESGSEPRSTRSYGAPTTSLSVLVLSRERSFDSWGSRGR